MIRKNKKNRKEISWQHIQIIQQAGSPVFAISGCPRQRRKRNRTRQTGGRHPENAGTGTYGGYLPAGDQRNCRRTGKNTRMVRRRRSAPCIQDGCRYKAAKQERGSPRIMPRGSCVTAGTVLRVRETCGILAENVQQQRRKAAGPAIRLPYFSTFMIYYRGLS